MRKPVPRAKTIPRKATRKEAVAQRRLPIAEEPRAQVPCLSCGLCCTYVAIDIDGPNTLRGATTILWYLYHRGVSVYVQDDEWMVQFEARCNHLQADNRCGIYEKRPPICRDFDETTCEVNAGEVGSTFYTPPDFLTYLQTRHKRIHTLVQKRYVADDGKRSRLPVNLRDRTPLALPLQDGA